MQVLILGSGDAFCSGGRHNTCLHLSALDGSGDPEMLVDCGATSLVALQRARIERNAIATILVSHFHGDHFGGVPFFVLDAQFACRRTEPLTIAGPAGIEARFHAAFEAAFPGYAAMQRGFDIGFVEVVPGAPMPLPGCMVTAFPMVHDERAGPCQGYRIAAGGTVLAFSVAHDGSIVIGSSPAAVTSAL